MNDTIYRQAAIDLWVWGDTDMAAHSRVVHVEDIEALPSAQLQSITCDGCKYVGTYDTDFPCSSCIRREKDYYAPEE